MLREAPAPLSNGGSPRTRRVSAATARRAATGAAISPLPGRQRRRLPVSLRRSLKARGKPLNKATLLRAAYAGQPVPTTGDQVIKQLMSKLRGRGAKISYHSGLGWILLAPPPPDEAPLPPGEHPTLRQAVLDTVAAAEGEVVPAPTLLAAISGPGGSSARLVGTALLKLVGDLRRRGHDIRGNATLGYWMPDCARPAQSLNGHRIPSQRFCLKCREQFRDRGPAALPVQEVQASTTAPRCWSSRWSARGHGDERRRARARRGAAARRLRGRAAADRWV